MPANVSYWQSPIGWFRIEATEKGIKSITPTTKPKTAASSPVLDSCVRQLNEYIAGKRSSFDVTFDHGGTDFQQKVWNAARAIPHGETRTYGQLAAIAGSPRASRAVGSALGKNPVPIITPCHRIVPSTGGVGQFAWGSKKKEWLLELEKTGKEEVSS